MKAIPHCINAHWHAPADSITRNEQVDRAPCAFGDCDGERFAGLPVCFMCAIMISQFMRDVCGGEPRDLIEPEELQLRVDELITPPDGVNVVYYLMLSPVTVKIGTSKNLVKRISQLRSELQYVVALEPGYVDLERQRHQEFAAERRDRRREDFQLSDRLKAHIDSLANQRDELLDLALSNSRRTTAE